MNEKSKVAVAACLADGAIKFLHFVFVSEAYNTGFFFYCISNKRGGIV